MYFKRSTLLLICTFLFSQSALAETKTSISTKTISDLAEQASALLELTPNVMQFETAGELTAFQKNQLLPFNRDIFALRGRKLENLDLASCEIFVKFTANWFDNIVAFKVGQISASDLDAFMAIETENLTNQSDDCAKALPNHSS